MNPTAKRLVKLLFVITVLALGLGSVDAQVNEQTSEDIKVPILEGYGSRYFRCFAAKQGVYDEESFKRLTADKDCASGFGDLKPDFKTETVIGIVAHGDCFINANASVFRNDTEKIYKVRVRKFWGGCRAGGSFRGLFTIEKIRPEYKVEFSETRAEKYEAGDSRDLLNPFLLRKTEFPETLSFDIKGCIGAIGSSFYVIKDAKTFDKLLTADNRRDWCLKNLEKIDFDKNSLVGVTIRSDYCRIPLGLEYKTVKDRAKNQYLLSISYLKPQSQCRRIGLYNLWVLMPKIPDSYEVKYEIKVKF